MPVLPHPPFPKHGFLQFPKEKVHPEPSDKSDITNKTLGVTAKLNTILFIPEQTDLVLNVNDNRLVGYRFPSLVLENPHVLHILLSAS